MAYTQESALSFSLQDSAGVRGSLHVPALWDPTRTLAQVAAAWNAQAALLDAVTGAKILNGAVVIRLAGAGMTFTPKSPSPINPSEVEKTGNTNYPNVVSGALYDSIIPAVQAAILTAGGGKIDETNAAYIAYIAPFETPPVDWAATNNVYQRIGAHVDTFVSFRKHRRALGRISRETP